MDVFRRRPFKLMIIDPSKTWLEFSKNEQRGNESPRTSSIIHNKFDAPSRYSLNPAPTELISVAHYRTEPDGLLQCRSTLKTQMRKKTDSKEWCKDMTAFGDHKQRKEALIIMLSALSNISDSHLGRISTALYRTGHTYDNACLVHSAPYWAGYKSRPFAATEVDKML